MSFLLDTSVISEPAKPDPDGGVMDWLASVDEEQLYLSVVSLAELRHGVERLTAGKRKVALDHWLAEQLAARFETRLLPVDVDTASMWGRIVAMRQAAGRPIAAMDAFIAAIATQHQLTLVTRNVANFEGAGVQLFNPWTEGNGS